MKCGFTWKGCGGLLLNDIKQQLEQVNKQVYYGMVDENYNEPVWDYLVFNRRKLRVNQNKNSYSDLFDVHIICENFIPETLDKEVIEKVTEINGVRLMDEDGEYIYMQKPNTNIVVEMLTLHFARARK